MISPYAEQLSHCPLTGLKENKGYLSLGLKLGSDSRVWDRHQLRHIWMALTGAAVRIQVIYELTYYNRRTARIQYNPRKRHSQRLNVGGVFLQNSTYVIKPCKCKILHFASSACGQSNINEGPLTQWRWGSEAFNRTQETAPSHPNLGNSALFATRRYGYTVFESYRIVARS